MHEFKSETMDSFKFFKCNKLSILLLDAVVATKLN
jgi:hypothetical protein